MRRPLRPRSRNRCSRSICRSSSRACGERSGKGGHRGYDSTMPAAPCLSDEEVLLLVRDSLDETARDRAHRHLDGCETCRSLMAEVAASEAEVAASEGGSAAAEGWSNLAAGSKIGRYVVREAVGAGAMGAVFAAHDPQLGRTVALKLLRGGAANA